MPITFLTNEDGEGYESRLKALENSQSVYYIATDHGISTTADDNTPALQALIDAVATTGGGVIWFPVGTYSFKRCGEQYDKDGYLIDYALTLKSNVSIVGENRIGTVLRQSESVPYALFLRMATADEPLISATGLSPQNHISPAESPLFATARSNMNGLGLRKPHSLEAIINSK